MRPITPIRPMHLFLAVLIAGLCFTIAAAQAEPEAVSPLGTRLFAQADEKNRDRGSRREARCRCEKY